LPSIGIGAFPLFRSAPTGEDDSVAEDELALSVEKERENAGHWAWGKLQSGIGQHHHSKWIADDAAIAGKRMAHRDAPRE